MKLKTAQSLLYASRHIVRKYYKYVDTAFTTPVLSDDGLLNGYMFAVEGLPRGTNYAWHLFDGSTSTAFSPYNQTGAIGDTHLIMFNPDLLNITNLAMTNRSATSGAAVRAGDILVSDDNTTYTKITSFTNDVTAPLATWNIDLSSNTGFYNYYKIQFTVWDYNSTYARALAEIGITATQRQVILSDESDYDYYEDVNAYMAVA